MSQPTRRCLPSALLRPSGLSLGGIPEKANTLLPGQPQTVVITPEIQSGGTGRRGVPCLARVQLSSSPPHLRGCARATQVTTFHPGTASS